MVVWAELGLARGRATGQQCQPVPPHRRRRHHLFGVRGAGISLGRIAETTRPGPSSGPFRRHDDRV